MDNLINWVVGGEAEVDRITCAIAYAYSRNLAMEVSEIAFHIFKNNLLVRSNYVLIFLL